MGVRITALPALTTLTNDDISVWVNDVSGSNPTTTQVTFQDLRTNVIAGTALDSVIVTANGDTLVTGASSNTVLMQGDVIQNTANVNYISGNTLNIDANTTFTGNNLTLNTIMQNFGNTTLGTPYSVGDPAVEVVPTTQIDGTLVINASSNIVGLSLLDLDNANGDNIADGTDAQVLTTDGSGGFKFANTVPFAEWDPATHADGSVLAFDDGHWPAATWQHTDPFSVTLTEEHSITNGQSITLNATGMTYDGVDYYAKATNSTHVEFYSDEALTAAVDGSGFTGTPPAGATITNGLPAYEPRILVLNELGNVDVSAPTDGQRLSWNDSNGQWEPVDAVAATDLDTLTDVDTTTVAPTNGDRLHWDGTNWVPVAPSNSGGGTSGVGIVTDTANATNMSLTGGESLAWHSMEYDIVDVKEQGGLLYVDLGAEAHGYNHLGDTAWGVFDMSGATGAAEIDYDAAVFHKFTREDADPAVSTYYQVGAHSSIVADGVTLDEPSLGGNTSSWTSGGKFIRVNEQEPALGANTGGGFVIQTTAPASALGELTNVDLATLTNGRPYLKYNPSTTNWEPVSASALNTGTGYEVDADTSTVANGHTLVWQDHEYPILDITEVSNQLYVDFGQTFHSNSHVGMSGYCVFDMSGAVGATEIGYQSGVWHHLLRVNNDPTVNSYYSVQTANIFSSDALEQYLGPNTSAWTSGGSMIKVDGEGANTVGSFVATSSGGGGGGGASAIDDLTDVDTSTNAPSNGNLLVWNASGSEWVANTVPVTGSYTFDSPTQEKITIDTSNSGLADYDCANSAIHYLSNITSDVEANLTNLPLDTGYATTVTFVLTQGATARMVDVIKIAGATQTIKWVGGAVPTGTASGVDAVSFSIIRTATSTYTVLGQSVPFS